MHFGIFFICMFLFTAVRFWFAGFRKDQLGALRFDQDKYNVAGDRRFEYLILICGFVLIDLYLYGKLGGENAWLALFAVIDGNFVSLGIFHILYKAPACGIYENGIYAADGPVLYGTLRLCTIREEAAQKMSVCTFQQKNLHRKPVSFLVEPEHLSFLKKTLAKHGVR